MKKKLFIVGLIGALTTLPAAAERLYVLGDAGKVTLSGGGLDETDTNFSIGLGYTLNSHFAIEGSFRDLGEVSASYQDTYQNAPISVKEKLEFSALQLSLIAQAPINEKFSPFARLGVAKLKAKYTISAHADVDDSSASQSTSDSENKIVYGLGARYSLNDKTGIRFEYDKYAEWDELSFSTLSVGIDYKF